MGDVIHLVSSAVQVRLADGPTGFRITVEGVPPGQFPERGANDYLTAARITYDMAIELNCPVLDTTAWNREFKRRQKELEEAQRLKGAPPGDDAA